MGVDEVTGAESGEATALEESGSDTIAPPAPDTDPNALADADDTGEHPAEGDPARPLLVLDRDGTLVDFVRDEETGFVGVAFHPSQLRLLAGVERGLKKLQNAGYRFAIATNQPGPAKGQYTAEAMARTNDALVVMLRDLDIDVEYIASCMHHPDGGPGGDAALVGPCDCRKPKAGLLEEIFSALGAPRETSWVVGDQLSDVMAGKVLGLKTALLLDVRRCELCPNKGSAHSAKPDVTVPTLDALADLLLAAAAATAATAVSPS
jgi:D-glycero-D-manno-heptose 1,7-bisphosphate phosphatase